MVSGYSHSAMGVLLLFVFLGQGTFSSAPHDPGEQTPKPICEIPNPRFVHVAAFLPTNERVLLGGGDCFGPGELRLCKISTLEPERIQKEHQWSIWSVAVSPDGTKIATGGGFGEVKVCDALSGKVLAHFDAGGDYTYALAFSSDGHLLANAACASVKIWDMQTLTELARVPNVKSAPHGIAFSPDDKLLVFTDDREVRFWDVKTRKDAFKIPGVSASPILFTPDGEDVIFSGDLEEPGLIRVWNLKAQKQTRVFKGHANTFRGSTAAVIALARDKQGKYLVSGGGDQTVRLWELATGKELLCLSDHKAIVRSVDISKGNQYLVTCSDVLIRVWDFKQLFKVASR